MLKTFCSYLEEAYSSAVDAHKIYTYGVHCSTGIFHQPNYTNVGEHEWAGLPGVIYTTRPHRKPTTQR